MKESTKPWHALLPGGLSPAAFSLDELRAAKGAHAFLTEGIPGPRDIAETIRAFRYLCSSGSAASPRTSTRRSPAAGGSSS